MENYKPTPPNILFAKGHHRFALLVRKVGLEPTRVIHSQDFKSCASANFATRAFNLYCLLWEDNTIYTPP